jgi:hypothetical protein
MRGRFPKALVSRFDVWAMPLNTFVEKSALLGVI